jgi:adenine-specific DNA methylase
VSLSIFFLVSPGLIYNYETISGKDEIKNTKYAFPVAGVLYEICLLINASCVYDNFFDK